MCVSNSLQLSGGKLNHLRLMYIVFRMYLGQQNVDLIGKHIRYFGTI